ncbi:hypothetical protein BDN72DRAFT_900753 [Pluteus cervinus]|uniref:Uncharacterized protein n=1 Tax=Pluteus cervinus TaxID=181527 RepID=A0ACD3AHI9_9AGAR|nr:hypothetical protein BDN72DRAFT_900753 [Pluteus cervinus]
MKASLILFVLVVVVTMWVKHAMNHLEDRLWECAMDFLEGWAGRVDMSGIRPCFRLCLVDFFWTSAIIALVYAAFILQFTLDLDRFVYQ